MSYSYYDVGLVRRRMVYGLYCRRGIRAWLPEDKNKRHAMGILMDYMVQ